MPLICSAVPIPFMVIGQDNLKLPPVNDGHQTPAIDADKVASMVGEWNADVVPPLGFGLIHDSAG